MLNVMRAIKSAPPANFRSQVLSSYRLLLKETRKLPDPFLMGKVKQIARQQYSKPIKISIGWKKSLKTAQAASKLIRNCVSNDYDSVVRLIKLAFSIEAEKSLGLKAQVAILQKNPQYLQLNPKQRDYVKEIVMKCCQVPEQLDLHQYLLETKKETWKFAIPAEHAQLINQKVASEEAYAIHYQDLFGQQLGHKLAPQDKVIQQILAIRYFALV